MIAGLALLVLWPLMLFIALAIKFDSTGPVLFRQVRYGRRRRPFVLLKYRTLYVDQCDAPRAPIKQVTPGDPRVTPLGRLLRRTSLDELPQLLNVLRGDMAIVGPRPHPLALDDYFSPRIPRYNLRHAVKPGLTGLAQVNGCRGETASLEAMRNRVQYDLEYVRSCTCLVDLKVALLTCALMARKNAY